MKRRTTLACGFRVAAVAAAMGLLAPSLRAEESYIEVLDAFNEVSAKGAAASPRAQALAFKHNETLQHLRIQGKIPERTFQANQANFSRINNGFVESAATKNGLSYRPQQAAPGKVPTPGVDTDAIVSSGQPGRPMTAQQVSGARSDYNRSVNEFLAKNGVSGGRAPNTNTSIMPDPGSMTESEWRKAIDEADRAGEVVYKSPQAAAAEAKIRAGHPLTPAEASARVKEVSRLANEHFAHADQLDDAARKLPPGPQREALQAQAQIARHNGAKYVNRITETGNAMAAQNGLPPAGQTGGTMGKAAVRGVDQAKQAAAAGAMSQHFTEQATRSYAQNMANIARTSTDPAVVAQSEKAIAQAMQGLSPSAQGQLLESLRASNGEAFAKNVAKTMRTLPRPPPGASGGAAAPGRLSTAMKYLGPAAILYGGAKDLYGVATAKDPSHEAGKRLGGFVVGTAGAAAGAAVVGKAGTVAGGMIGSVFGPPGAVIGASVGGFVGAVVGGVGGYIYGSGHGTEMGDTNSKYWDKNKTDEEFNRLAAANHLKTPDEVYQSLLKMGVAPDRALALAKLYQSGSLGAFREGLAALRNEMVKNNKWTPKSFRRFGDLPDDERQRLLDCLCSASLGANPWVAQGYRPTLDGEPDPRYSCTDLANGPCMASGFGCWRSFIDWSRPGIADCLASFNISTNDRQAIYDIDKAANAPFEKPLTVTAKAEPATVCRGETVRITVDSTGGRGAKYFRVVAQEYSNTGNSPYAPEDRIRRFGNRELENLDRAVQLHIGELRAWETRGDMNIGNVWTNNRTFEVLAPHVTGSGYYMDVIVGAYAPGPQQQGVKDEAACMVFNKVRVLVLSDAECEWKDNKAKPKPRNPPEPAPGTGRGPHIGTPPATGGGTSGGGSGGGETEPGSPGPPEPSGGRGVQSPGNGKSQPAPPAASPPPGKPAVPSPAGPPADAPHDSGPAPGAPPPKPSHDPGWSTGRGWQGGTNVPADGVATSTPPGDCQIGGGGYAMEGQPAVIFAEVPPPQRVRLTIQGSDGYSQTAEGVGKAELTRPLNPNGTDVIVIENLDVPGCREAMQRTYGTNGMPIAQEPITGDVSTALGGLRGVEPPVSEGTILATPSSAADEFVTTRADGSAAKTQTGLGLMDAQAQLGAASRAGDKTLVDITRIRDSAGAAAAATRAQSAAQAAAADAKTSWGNTLGDAVSQGVEQGLSSAAASFGAAAADHVAGEIFDDGHSHDEGSNGATADTGTPPPSADAPPFASSPKNAAPAPKAKPSGHHHDQGSDHGGPTLPPPQPPPPASPSPTPSSAVTVTCPSCGVTTTFPDGNVPPWCPNCCAGPHSTECATCGYRWCGRNGPPPDCCPSCGTCGSGPAPESLVPPGSEILVTPADPGVPAGPSL